MNFQDTQNNRTSYTIQIIVQDPDLKKRTYIPYRYAAEWCVTIQRIFSEKNPLYFYSFFLGTYNPFNFLYNVLRFDVIFQLLTESGSKLTPTESPHLPFSLLIRTFL